MTDQDAKTKPSPFAHFKGDLFGGLTAGIVALPLALAFGVQSGLGAPAGLYGAIFISFFAAVFGGTPTQISGPTAPMTAVSMVIIAGLVQQFNGDMEGALPFILMVFFLAGLIQILLGFLKVGQLIKYIPYPVVSGFMTGIGVIILITQIPPLVGYDATNDQELINRFKPQAEEVLLDKILRDEADEGLLVLEDFRETVRRAELITSQEILIESKTLVARDAAGVIGSLKYILRAFQQVSWLELVLGLLTIMIIYGFKYITESIPSTLVALLVVTLLVVFAGLNASAIGEIPTGFPSIHLDIFANFSIWEISPFIFSALSLALLGAIDSLLTSVVADNMTKTKHDSDRELFGQGIGNSIAALFGGLPGAGATIRTVVNIQAGGKTKLSGMIAGLLLLVILLILGPYAEAIPQAVLAGILITVGFGVMDYKGLRALTSMPRTDAIVLIIVLTLTVFWDLIFAVGIGMVIACLMFMKKMSEVTAEESKVQPMEDSEVWSDEKIFPEHLREEVFIKHLHGPVFFGSTSEMQQLANQIPRTASTVIIRMERVPYLDKSGVNAMDSIIIDLINNDMKVLLVGLQKQPRYLMEVSDIIPDLISEEYIFEHVETCFTWISENVEDKYGPDQT
ncbi:MAG: SulP family inorganic anion transporter [Saprospiraceae bacterium]|nr:SulP family inorganic anion transporter [Saprospiraceae bacterium]